MMDFNAGEVRNSRQNLQGWVLGVEDSKPTGRKTRKEDPPCIVAVDLSVENYVADPRVENSIPSSLGIYVAKQRSLI